LKFAKPSVAAGGLIDGTITLTFASGLHGYQNPPDNQYEIPVEVKISEVGFSLVKAAYPKGTDFSMAGETKPTKVYQGRITIPIKVRAAKKPANYNVNLRIEYQECNAISCFPPSALIVKAPLTVK
jgi:DsbC/DsbD-like thiol-disulfide interchange protein